MTQEQVAKKAGFSRTYYTRIEEDVRGQNLPVKTAKAIAPALNFDWQRFYEDSSKSNNKGVG
jgi:transcriptional regulator with XRE-family HTH domain